MESRARVVVIGADEIKTLWLLESRGRAYTVRGVCI